VNSIALSARPTPERYDRRTIVLHWSTAVLVVVLWLSAQVIDLFPQGPARINMRSVHISLGVLLAGVLVYRIAWRRLAGARLPRVTCPALARFATPIHLLLYALLLIEVTLGCVNVWVRGESIYNLFSIPSFAPGDRALRRQINGYHEFVANTILIVAGLHAIAALAHHYLWRDGVLQRMWPSLRQRRAG
jgi:cytochrome b561